MLPHRLQQPAPLADHELAQLPRCGERDLVRAQLVEGAAVGLDGPVERQLVSPGLELPAGFGRLQAPNDRAEVGLGDTDDVIVVGQVGLKPDAKVSVINAPPATVAADDGEAESEDTAEDED